MGCRQSLQKGSRKATQEQREQEECGQQLVSVVLNSSEESALEQRSKSMGNRQDGSLESEKNSMSQEEFEKDLESVYAAKEAFYRKLELENGFELLETALAKLVNPFFFGGPKWPNLRQSHCCLRNWKRETAMIISDGLSDPFPPEELENADLPDEFENIGFEFEVFAEFKLSKKELERNFCEGLWVHQWQAILVDVVTQQLASRGRAVLNMLDKFGGAISTEVSLRNLSVGVPECLVTKKNTVGVLLFYCRDPSLPTSINLPNGTAKVISLRLINGEQLSHILNQETEEGTREARLDLVNSFCDNGTYHITDLNDLEN